MSEMEKLIEKCKEAVKGFRECGVTDELVLVVPLGTYLNYSPSSWELVGGGVACKRLNRKFIGIEIDEKYYKIASGRLEEAPAVDRGEQISIFDLIGE